jgi:hypothetical protein
LDAIKPSSAPLPQRATRGNIGQQRMLLAGRDVVHRGGDLRRKIWRATYAVWR